MVRYKNIFSFKLVENIATFIESFCAQQGVVLDQNKMRKISAVIGYVKEHGKENKDKSLFEQFMEFFLGDEELYRVLQELGPEGDYSFFTTEEPFVEGKLDNNGIALCLFYRDIFVNDEKGFYVYRK